jgi:hypothetical protein
MRLIISILTICIPSILFSQELPYNTAKKIDNLYYQIVKDMNILYQETIKHKDYQSSLILHKEEIELDNEHPISRAVIRIDDFYYLIYCNDPSIEITDLAGNDQNLEIIFETGCMSDAGCDAYTFVIRTFQNKPFTITNLGRLVSIAKYSEEISIINPYNVRGEEDNDDDQYYEQKLFKADIDKLRKNGEFIVIGDCYISQNGDFGYRRLESYTVSKKGFIKSAFFKLLKTICAG